VSLAGAVAAPGLALSRNAPLDPATKRYVAALQPALTGIADAMSKAHIACYHTSKGAANPACARLYRGVRDNTRSAVSALADIAAPAKLRAADKDLRAALVAFAARAAADYQALTSHHFKQFKGTHQNELAMVIDNAEVELIRLVPGLYLPLID
jgi:hypothetical protein